MRIAILSTDKLPEFLGDDHPMEDSLFAEDDRLIAELSKISIAAERISWRSGNENWSNYDATVIRSTWDYIDHPTLFFDTLKQIDASGIQMINPVETVQWNADKRYLAELARSDIPIVPTLFLERDRTGLSHLEDWLTDKKAVVLKPTVGVGGFGVRTFDTPAELLTLLNKSSDSSSLMVQPFQKSIAEEGEWSFVFGAGELLYAVLKKPKSGDFRVQVMYGASTAEMSPSQNDVSAARRVFENLPVTAHLARIDMARMESGSLALMEAELIEPQLYLFDVPRAAKKLAWAIKKTLYP